MRLSTSYSQILSISVPIMLGSAAQNIIVLCDNVFLYHVSELDFAAVGLVGVFYLIVASIGYGFSRGGQVLIARKFGERNYAEAGDYFKSLLFFEGLLAFGMFMFLTYGSEWFFGRFVDSEVLYQKCLEYIYPRSYGVFFSYIGVALIAFYTGIARTSFIIIDTLILAVVNIILNYVFIFGKFGFEPMGIAGAAWASTIAEVVAFVAFILYMLWDKKNRVYKFFKLDTIRFNHIHQTSHIASPIVWQSVLGLGSWFVFFSLVENMGQRPLEISNLLRNIYLILSIPCWGYSAGINTLVSNFIGAQKRQAVIPLILKTAKLNLVTTMIITIPVVLFPEFFLYVLFGRDDMSLVQESSAYLPLLALILAIFSIGSTFMNGLVGTGHTRTALWIQSLFSLFYVIYAVVAIKYLSVNLHWAWASEVFYWLGTGLVVFWYLSGRKWHVRKI